MSDQRAEYFRGLEPDPRDRRRGAGPGSKDDPQELSGARKRSVRAGYAQGAFPNAGPDDAPDQRV